MMELLDEKGPDWFKQYVVPAGIPCHILKAETPITLLIQAASRTNLSNESYTPMSWVDGLLNLWKFACAFGSNLDPPEVWYRTDREKLWNTYKVVIPMTWSELQKRMGLVTVLVTSVDDAAMTKHPLAYRDPETTTTPFMELLLFDEMDFGALRALPRSVFGSIGK